MNRSIQEIIKNAASPTGHPQKRLVSLLPLLEHEYSSTIAGILQPSGIDTGLLVGFAIAEGSDYWRGLALKWLAAGLPMNMALAETLETFGRGRLGTQHDRHEAFRLAIQWKKQSSPTS
jgi:hypothetical protein